MAEFQRMNGDKLPSSITMVVGTAIDLKLIPGRGELATIPIATSPANLAQVQAVVSRTAANFITFKLAATVPGTAKLYAGADANKPVAGPITVVIERPVSLPATGSDQGLLVRLLLAETPSPAILDETIKIANDGSDARRDKYNKFLNIALKVAALPSVRDPSAGLYFWRTVGSGSPSPEAKVFRTVMGNTFYSL